ncbi:MAG: alpha/beta hydrolase [Nocardioides sp.]|uniref:alpha/beta hydrolase n=1 Tax=Nocardioides sp. TaxID=35761 RepID=UPI0039E4350C
MTSTVLPAATSHAASHAAWDEPDGLAPRGTLILLPGRGESAATYGRLGRRLSADAYKVRYVEIDLDDLDAARDRVADLLDDADLPAPKVLLGADTGAAVAAALAADPRVDAAVIAGLALPSADTAGSGISGSETPQSAGSTDWDAELEARSACPAHRRVLSEDPEFDRGSLSLPVPPGLVPAPTDKPVLVLHGSADPVTLAADAFDEFRDVDGAELRLITGAHHDVLNDLSHRSVAATVILFLEHLKLGAGAPAIVHQIPR